MTICVRYLVAYKLHMLTCVVLFSAVLRPLYLQATIALQRFARLWLDMISLTESVVAA